MRMTYMTSELKSLSAGFYGLLWASASACLVNGHYVALEIFGAKRRKYEREAIDNEPFAIMD